MKELWEEAAAGLSAGVLGTAIGFPLDVVKTRMQTHRPRLSLSRNAAAGAAAAHPAAAGIFQTTTNIVRREGFASLYKGMLPPLISLSILNTFSFAAYSYSQHVWGATKSTWDVRNAVAAACVGPFCGVVSTFEGVVKTQLQVDNALRNRPHFSGSWDCVRQLTQQHGWSILYTGHVVNTAREMVFLVTYFFMYEGFRHELIHMGTDDEHFNKIAIPVAGGLSGALAWTASFPLDCVRAGVQGQDFSAAKAAAGAASPSTTSTARTNAVTVLRSILRTKGFLGLYHGVAPSIARAFLVSGSRFSAYEGTLYVLRGGRDVEHHD